MWDFTVKSDMKTNKAGTEIRMTVKWGIKEGLFEEMPSEPTDQCEMREHGSHRAREGHN